LTGLLPNGDKIPVTDENKRQYVNLRIMNVLVESRKMGLEAIKQGLYSIDELRSHLEILSPSDLRLLLSGHEHLDSNMIIDYLCFDGFPPNSNTPAHLIEFLKSVDSNNLRRFLIFVTEHDAIPSGGLVNRRQKSPTGKTAIIVKRLPKSNALPRAHTCFFQLDLPGTYKAIT